MSKKKETGRWAKFPLAMNELEPHVLVFSPEEFCSYQGQKLSIPEPAFSFLSPKSDFNKECHCTAKSHGQEGKTNALDA